MGIRTYMYKEVTGPLAMYSDSHFSAMKHTSIVYAVCISIITSIAIANSIVDCGNLQALN